jgi:hypothetical protein
MNPIRRFFQWLSGLARAGGGGSEFLCDTCRYNYGNACNRPERPNATTCPDYKRP